MDFTAVAAEVAHRLARGDGRRARTPLVPCSARAGRSGRRRVAHRRGPSLIRGADVMRRVARWCFTHRRHVLVVWPVLARATEPDEGRCAGLSRLPGVSQKSSLGHTARSPTRRTRLTARGATVPPRALYLLTDLGLSLEQPLTVLRLVRSAHGRNRPRRPGVRLRRPLTFDWRTPLRARRVAPSRRVLKPRGARRSLASRLDLPMSLARRRGWLCTGRASSRGRFDGRARARRASRPRRRRPPDGPRPEFGDPWA